MMILILKKSLVVGIIFLFVCSSFISCISGYSNESKQIITDYETDLLSNENVLVTSHIFGIFREHSNEVSIPYNEAEILYNKIKELEIEVANNPFSVNTQQLKQEIISIADDNNLLPADLSKDFLESNLISPMTYNNRKFESIPLNSKGSELFCTFVSGGSGGILPIIALPRLIPIFMTPIPRLLLIWKAQDGMTSCGGLLSGTGFIAYGQQRGLALGFWGIGFTFSLPPFMGIYGLIGYALFARVNAEEIEFYPPNNPPVISSENPPNSAYDIPVTLSELSFRIEDADGDHMSYSVTTEPYIGSGSGNNKNNGFYSIPISDIEYDKSYRWTIEVTDGKDTTIKQYSFFTEVGPPFNPFDEDWQYRKKVTIDHTQVAGNFMKFPVLISTIDTDLLDKAQDDGDDILFMDDIGVAKKLYHEIEKYDDSTGELVAWVNVADISSNEDTVLYMYYGNPGCNSQQVPKKVWDSSYCGVWHLDNFYDSTMKDNDGTNHGTDDVIGKIGSAKDFVSSNSEYIDLGDMPEPCDDTIDTATFEMWIKPNTLTDGKLLSKHNSKVEPDIKTYEVEVLIDGKIRFEFWSGTWYPSHKKIIVTTDDAHVSIGSWQYIVVVADVASRDVKIYYNGDEKPSATVLEGDPNPYFTDISWSEHLGRLTGSSIKYYNGCIDEVRISKTCKSAKWISTEYSNQNNPSIFLSFSPEETGP